MLHAFFSRSLTALAAVSLLGCAERPAGPEPGCLTGTVVAVTCVDGVLIDVDPHFPIGGPAYVPREDGEVLLGRNVVAVLNSQTLNSMGRPGPNGSLSALGRRLYFTAGPADSAQTGPRCRAADGMRGAFPTVTLANVSTSGCQQVEGPRCGNE